MSETAPALLTVEDLRVALLLPDDVVAEAVRGVDLTLRSGGTLGVVGESGCGKSLTALAVMGLLPEGATASGVVRLAGRDLLALSERDLCALRGVRMAMIFQEPMTALNPLHPVGRQVAEPLVLHRGLSAAAAGAEALRLLDAVRLPDAAARARAYPHQLSGGQRQRVQIAMALACEPDLLIADEPTTALDVTTQALILDLLAELTAERGMATILISHDLAVVGAMTGAVAVMYGGLVVETGPTAAVFADLAHPYSLGLFRARPRPGGRGRRLADVPGAVPPLGRTPPGCPFAPRCPLAISACREGVPPLLPAAPGRSPDHLARCIRLDQSRSAWDGAA